MKYCQQNPIAMLLKRVAQRSFDLIHQKIGGPERHNKKKAEPNE
jgi:hypothetical protein